jgi:hypothetical protein
MKRSRASLFLMEQIIVIAVFALCAAVCVKIIVVSYSMSADAVDTRRALLMAENTAEVHRATGGNSALVAEFMSGTVNAQGMAAYFCSDWIPTERAYAAFVLDMQQREGAWGATRAEIAVRRLRDDKMLVQLSTAVRGGGGE